MPDRPPIARPLLVLVPALAMVAVGCGHSRKPSAAIAGAPAYRFETPDTGAVHSAKAADNADAPRATPVAERSARPASGPDLPVGQSSGGYSTLGGVVARVNGKPIFSDEVLAAAGPKLAEAAPAMTAAQFTPVAFAAIRDALGGMIREELEVAAAERGLRPADLKLADNLTGQWRETQISAAGGSVELTRQRATADGKNFDAEVEEQHREFLRQIYYQKKVFPRLQVTVDDVRRYYDSHRKDQFTVPAKLEFRVIKVSADAAGSPEAAMAKAKTLLSRIKAGTSFEAVAAEANDDPMLKRTGGDLKLGLIDRGAYRIAPVEDAAYALQPGGVGGPVADEAGDAYLVKLVKKEGGNVIPFADVQDEVKRAMQIRQMAAMEDQRRQRLVSEATVEQDPDLLKATLELAVKRYTGGDAVPLESTPSGR